MGGGVGLVQNVLQGLVAVASHRRRTDAQRVTLHTNKQTNKQPLNPSTQTLIKNELILSRQLKQFFRFFGNKFWDSQTVPKKSKGDFKSLISS